LVVEDAINGHQRSKIERYGDLLYVVVHPAVLNHEFQRVYYGEIHAIVGPDFAITICNDDGPTSSTIVEHIDRDHTLAGHSSLALLHALLDAVVDGYAPIIESFENEIDDVEDRLFTGVVFERIYDLLREVIVLQRATHSLQAIVQSLADGSVFHASPGDTDADNLPAGNDLELRRQWRDVLDHAIANSERTDEFRQMLENALAVHSTLVAQNQNEEMARMTATSIELAEMTKKVSSWAAIIFAPTLIAGIYGMNFQHLPEFAWPYGYPFALGLMVFFVLLLYVLFKRANWL